jgi:tetratricopeptide (TPR) repeat protein
VGTRAWLVLGVVVLGGLGWAGHRWQQAQALARLPTPPTVGRSEAVAEHLRGRYEEARRNPASIDAVGPLCVAYHADMFYAEAERCYAVAAELDGDWRWVYRRALIQAERGGGDALLTALREVTGRAPEFAPAWIRLGDAEFKAGRYAAAAAAWQRASAIADSTGTSGTPLHVIEIPLSAYASFGLARVALVEGQPDRAREILEGVTAKAPQFGPAWRLLADSYRAVGREAEASRAVYRAGRLPPYTPHGDPLLDELARESRNSVLLLRVASEANLALNAPWSEHLTRRALEFDPNSPEAVQKLARVLRAIGRAADALPLFERYHELVPGDFQGLAQIGSCLSALGRYREAESYLRQALAGLDDPVTHYNMGLLFAVTGRLDEAVGEYEKALERDPMHGDARLNLATALARQGRADRAARELMRVLESDPENVGALTNLGLILAGQGSTARARPYLEEALRLEPDLAVARNALASLTP